MFLDQVSDPGPARDLLAPDEDEPVTRPDSGQFCRAVRGNGSDDRWDCQPPRLHADGLQRVLLAEIIRQLGEIQQVVRPLSGGVLDRHGDGVPVQRVGDQVENGMRPGAGIFAIHAGDRVPGLDTRLGRDAGHRSDEGARLRDTDQEHQPESQHREDQVENRAGGDDGDAGGDRLAVEGLTELVGRHFALAFVEHLDVAAQRKGGHGVLGPLGVSPRPEGAPEPDREAQHANTQPPRHPEVAELVEGDQQAQRDQQPPD
jgi:hypothetical protein